MKEAAHLIRAAAVLAAGLVLFVLLRTQLVPSGFGQYGHYRAGALAENRPQEIQYAGRAACAACHDDVVQILKDSRHSTIGCESCHGAQARHAADPSTASVALPDSQKLCSRCHDLHSARPKKFPQVVAQEHSGGEACNSCHQPHTPRIGG